jgi:purine-nucleoside phosphorylase
MSTPSPGRFWDRCREDPPEVFVVLGSGLADVAERPGRIDTLAFADIPGLTAPGVAGHRGQLTLGRWAQRTVLVSEGRLHYYEGHPWEVVIRPIQLAAQMGARYAILTNAAGGIRPDLGPGGLMPISGHLQWNRPSPWREPASPNPYSPHLLRLVGEAGASLGMDLRPGTYAAVRGPSYETPAEIRALASVGAAAVGMSTSREVEAGHALGLECAAISLITNRAAGLSRQALSHEEVLAVSRSSGRRLGDLLERLLILLPRCPRTAPRTPS